MLLLVDLDGVVYRGAQPVPGVAAVLAARAAAGDEVVYVTNNSMTYRADYVTRLQSMGAPVGPDRIVTSARATALFLADSTPVPRRVLVVGGAGLVHEVLDVGIEAEPSAEAAERWNANGRDAAAAVAGIDTVVVGLDIEFTYARLAVAVGAVRAGARFVATNRDPLYPMEHGLMPGAGSVVAAIEAASGVTPVSIGKPWPLLLEIAAHAVWAGRRDLGRDDRRQPRHGHSGGPGRRRALHPDADRHYHRCAGGRAARRRAPDRGSLGRGGAFGRPGSTGPRLTSPWVPSAPASLPSATPV